MAKKEPFTTGGDPIKEAGELWFEFGATKYEALSKLQKETRSLLH